MDDLISREAVINALDAICERECEYSKKQRAYMCGSCRLGSAFDAIDELPSAEEKRGISMTEKDKTINELRVENEKLKALNLELLDKIDELKTQNRFVKLTSSGQPKTGRWVPHPDPENREWDVCTACGIGCKRREYGTNPDGMEWEAQFNYPYCPNCGAKMGG